MAEVSGFVRGDTWRMRCRITVKATGLPLPLAGATFLAQVRQNPDSSTVLATIAVAGPDEDDWLDLSLTAAQTATLFTKNVFDLQITFPSGDVKTYMPSRALIMTKDTSRAA